MTDPRFLVQSPRGGEKYRWDVIDPLVADMLEAGSTYSEIAASLGLPYATLKSRAGLHKKKEATRSVEAERRAEWIRRLPPVHPISRAIAELRAAR